MVKLGMPKFENLVGQKFNRLLVLERVENSQGRTCYMCLCDCGNMIKVIAKNLKNGNTKSCGCLKREATIDYNKRYRLRNVTHGMTNTRIYRIWKGIKSRCYLSTHDKYDYYGGRGISMCDDWKESFETFYDWAISNGYEDNLTIDRINK